jgi:tetratricopeptide (TPR) repeat protein
MCYFGSIQPMLMPTQFLRHLPTLTFAALLLSQSAAQSALPVDISSKMLQGRASMTHDKWERFYTSGTQALDKRMHEQAAQRLDSALSELRHRNIADLRFVQTREALGRALLGLEKYDDAERILTDADLKASKLGSVGDSTRARASEALAETLFARRKFDKAEQEARKALQNCETSGVNEPRFEGRAHMTLGDALAARGLDVDAGDEFKKALAILSAGGLDERDLADAHYRYGLLLRAQGAETEAATHFNKAFAVFDKEAQFNRPLSQSSRLTLHWEDGSPRARVVPDQDYPLKYVTVDGLRVAATLVRSENVIVGLISLANCSRNKKELSLGQVSLQQLAPSNKTFRLVHPVELDTTLEAEHLTELTWRRRWLNHIEKTRRIPGYLKDGVLDVDNFFGNNIFTDRFGQWQSMARGETPIVTREQFLYSAYRENPQDSADFLSHTPVGTRPTSLEAGDSKTGLVYFGQERFERAILKIAIGNTVVEIPFESAGPR